MKTASSILLFLSISLAAFGQTGSATATLDPDLVPVYERLGKPGSTSLLGMRLELTLNLKHASDKYLLFTDTQVVVDAETKYYLIKWKFKPDDVRAILGKSNVTCKVTGRIVGVIDGPTSPRMPYVVVELLSVEL